MVKVIYEVVRHDGGFAYKVGNVFSEAFPTHEAAHAAAAEAAERQKLAGQTVHILYEDSGGKWREETADGDDRPETGLVDDAGD